jgi:hypothetical protein
VASKEIKVYKDWSGGHWGRLGPFKAPDNMYRSVNLQMYANGTLGPRPGWKLLETTGTAPAPAAGSGSEFYGMCWTPGATDGGYLLFVSKTDATACRKLDMDTLVWESAAVGVPTSDMPLEAPGAGNIFTHVADWFIVGGTKFYDAKNNLLASTITWPSSFSPKSAVVYKNRMYSWGDATYPGRFYYSDAGNYIGVDSTQFFDIGNPSYTYIVGAWVLKDSLVILTLLGNIANRQTAAEWWVLTGANPITGTLRRLTKGEWPYVPEYAVQYRDSLLWLDTLYDHGIYIHNGTDLDTTALARLVARSGSDTVNVASQLMKPTATYGEPSVILPYRVSTFDDTTATVVGDFYENGLQAWELVNGVWTKASYWNGATEEVVDNGVPFLWAVTDWGGNRLIAATNTSSDGSGEFKFFCREVTLNRPSNAGATYNDADEEHSDIASSGDGLDCRLWLTPIQADEGSGVRVTKIVVDFDYWQSNFYPAGAGMSAKILNFRQNRGWSGETEELTADFSILEDSTNVLPSRGRYVFRFPDTGWYSASQVYFTSLRNVAIDSVSVHFDRNPQEPV